MNKPNTMVIALAPNKTIPNDIVNAVPVINKISCTYKMKYGMNTCKPMLKTMNAARVIYKTGLSLMTFGLKP